jgi:glycosyltransferase involved in cell wall biosynthesis
MKEPKMAHPRFSIVIPTYNREDLVGYTIQSVLNQTFADFEIIVCDNCSTDETAKVVRQYSDPRVKYVKTPRHMVIADNWEFARSHASGELIIMLGDDDALLGSALERFAEAATRHEADFLFCRTVEYRDLGFPGSDRNTLDCPPFAGSSRKISVDEFLKPLFSCRLVFDMHPSSFFFGRALGDAVAKRCGRFFQTNGVEYCAWPMAAAFAKGIALVDLPLSICGRTSKSWGSNMILGNPGKQRIRQFVQDVEQGRKFAPLTNFTMANLRAEGILTAKNLFPQEFQAYEFDELKYMRDTLDELESRKSLGVDVSCEMQDLVNHLGNHPELRKEILEKPQAAEQTRKSLWRQVRGWVGDRGLRALRNRMIKQRQEKLRIHHDRLRVSRGDTRTGFRISGADFRFSNIVEGADALARLIGSQPVSKTSN